MQIRRTANTDGSKQQAKTEPISQLTSEVLRRTPVDILDCQGCYYNADGVSGGE